MRTGTICYQIAHPLATPAEPGFSLVVGWSIRLRGDAHILPGLLGARADVHTEQKTDHCRQRETNMPVMIVPLRQ